MCCFTLFFDDLNIRTFISFSRIDLITLKEYPFVSSLRFLTLEHGDIIRAWVLFNWILRQAHKLTSDEKTCHIEKIESIQQFFLFTLFIILGYLNEWNLSHHCSYVDWKEWIPVCLQYSPWSLSFYTHLLIFDFPRLTCNYTTLHNLTELSLNWSHFFLSYL